MAFSFHRTGRHVMNAAAGALVVAGLALSGCGSEDSPSSSAKSTGSQGNQAEVTPGEATEKSNALGPSNAVAIDIPTIGVKAPIMKVGLTKNGKGVKDPPLSKPNLAGWYENAASPGEIGPAVILGHVDTGKGPAVFNKVKNLKKGDKVHVKREDGKTVVYEVTELKQYPKKALPGQDVFAAQLDYPGLRLITCGGVFDKSTGHYKDNILAYGKMVATR